jgi:hypothetical protein
MWGRTHYNVHSSRSRAEPSPPSHPRGMLAGPYGQTSRASSIQTRCATKNPSVPVCVICARGLPLRRAANKPTAEDIRVDFVLMISILAPVAEAEAVVAESNPLDAWYGNMLSVAISPRLNESSPKQRAVSSKRGPAYGANRPMASSIEA